MRWMSSPFVFKSLKNSVSKGFLQRKEFVWHEVCVSNLQRKKRIGERQSEGKYAKKN